MSTAPPGPNGLPALPPELDPRRRGRRRRHSEPGNGRRGLGVAAIAFFTVLSVVCLSAFAYGWWNYRKLNNNLQRLDVTVGTAANGGTGPGGGQNAGDDIDGKDQNILIVGNDDRSNLTNRQVKELKVGRDGGSLNTDTMMIVHVPANGSKATLISLPRDSYVAIPGYGMNRLNAAYAFGYNDAGGSPDARRAAGANLLVRTVHNLTGLTIDHFVQVSLIGFVNISDAVGGVTVNLCNAVDDAHYSHLVLPAGKHTIKGVTALEFVRQRHGLPNGDLDRVARQRYFLTAAFRKVASAGVLLNPGRLSKLISAVDTSIYVDKGLVLTKLAAQMANLSANNIVGKTIPTTPVTINGADVLQVDPTAVKAFVAKVIGTDNSTLAKAKTLAPKTVNVDVVNGSGVDGAATRNAAVLAQAGFRTTVDQKGANASSTVIQYASGMESQAKTLAAYVPGATYQKVGSVKQVTLLLGADGLQARKAPTTSSTKPAPKKSTSPKAKPIDSGCIN